MSISKTMTSSAQSSATASLQSPIPQKREKFFAELSKRIWVEKILNLVPFSKLLIFGMASKYANKLMAATVVDKDSPFKATTLSSPPFATPLKIHSSTHSSPLSSPGSETLPPAKVDLESTLLFSCPEQIFSIRVQDATLICSTPTHFYKYRMDMPLKERMFIFMNHSGLTFGLWSDFIVIPDQNNILLVSSIGKVALEYLSPEESVLTAFEISHEKIALGYSDGSIYIIDLTISKIFFTEKFVSITSLEALGYAEKLEMHTEPVMNLKIKENQVLMSTDSTGRTIFWNLSEPSSESAETCESEPNLKGELLVFSDQEIIKLYDAQSKEFISVMQGHLGDITTMHIQKNLLFTGDEFGEVMVWDLNTQKRLYLLAVTPHKDVTSILVYQNQLIAADESGKVYSWKLKEFEPK